VRGRTILALLMLSTVVAGCGRLGLGRADCTPPERGISAANILTVQAVPTAKYSPCINELRLGWESVEWFAEDGEAGIRFLGNADAFDSLSAFLTATVTRSCDTSGGVEVTSEYPDIQKFEEITRRPVPLVVTIIPTVGGPLIAARRLAERLSDTRLNDREVEFVIDDALGRPTSDRLEDALAAGHYVWILDELAADEGTVEMRSNDPRVGGSGLSPEDALDEIEDRLPDLHYTGSWYFVFEGGCITYEFDAGGPLAATVAEDATDVVGFFPAGQLRAIAEDAGYDLGE